MRQSNKRDRHLRYRARVSLPSGLRRLCPHLLDIRRRQPGRRMAGPAAPAGRIAPPSGIFAIPAPRTRRRSRRRIGTGHAGKLGQFGDCRRAIHGSGRADFERGFVRSAKRAAPRGPGLTSAYLSPPLYGRIAPQKRRPGIARAVALMPAITMERWDSILANE